ncbi:MAG TPA: (2Fe-2S)-binding protein [Elusimicrobiota bacterium]|nr:(2Fe-2S)-binding protein [Elusimicrobiota bacterium]
MKNISIQLKLNGVRRTLEVEPSDVLLDVLRDKLGVKSPKVGCDRGDCGSCTVFMNGKTVRSCLVLAVEADGADVVTLEGISKNGPTRLQKEFVKRNSFQCGFCAPGVILSAEEALKKHPRASDEEIKEHIAGNLCRCTGYKPILDAIKTVASGKASK